MSLKIYRILGVLKMFDKILIPTDGSDFSENEVKRATQLLAEDGEIIILSVASKIEANTPFHNKKNVHRMNKEFKNEAQMNADRMARKFDKSVNVRRLVIAGIPSETIVNVADNEDVDLIMIAASGKSGLKKFFIGSVAERVLKTTEKDVLLIRN